MRMGRRPHGIEGIRQRSGAAAALSIARYAQHFLAAGDAGGDQAFAVFAHQLHAARPGAQVGDTPGRGGLRAGGWAGGQ